MLSFALAGWFFVAVSVYNNIHPKGNREWGERAYLYALLNWIIYYLSMGKA